MDAQLPNLPFFFPPNLAQLQNHSTLSRGFYKWALNIPKLSSTRTSKLICLES